MSLKSSLEDVAASQSLTTKTISTVAASLGIGSFLGFVNLAVGVLSGLWLALQIYGYVKYELPTKHYKRAKAKRDAERGFTAPAPLERLEADE